MSYICLIANESGISAAGDSRLTITPKQLHLHFDTLRKVYLDEEQGLVWACCGLTIYAGVNYFRLAERTLRSRNRSMGAKLERIAKVLERATWLQHLIIRQRSSFTLLLGSLEGGMPKVVRLEVANGKRKLTTYEGPVALESGSGVGLGDPLPEGEALRQLSLEEVVATVRQRTADAIERSCQRARENSGCLQTVGGNIRVVYLQP